MTKTADHARSLWRLAVPPAVWFAHFAGCYAVAAVSCEKTGAPAPAALAALTALAAASLLALGLSGRRHGGFLGRAELLLSALSLAGTLAAGAAALLAGGCR